MKTQWIRQSYVLFDIEEGDAWVAPYDDFGRNPNVRSEPPVFTLTLFALNAEGCESYTTIRQSLSLDEATTLAELILSAKADYEAKKAKAEAELEDIYKGQDDEN